MALKRIWVVAGDAGTGKSTLGMDVGKENPEATTEFWDIECKNKDLQDKYFSDRLINRRDLLVFDNNFLEDWYATYLVLRKEVDGIIKLGQEVRSGKRKDIGFSWLIVDGISPIRNNIMLAKWLYDHSEKVTGKKSRAQPNEFEWADINEGVRNLLFPLINMTVAGIIPNLLFTAEFKDSYEAIEVFDERQNKIVKKSVKVGREPAYNDYLGYKLYTLLELHEDIKKKTYSIVCTKSLIGMWSEDVTKKSAYDIILSKGL
jgi:hypothetical protein